MLTYPSKCTGLHCNHLGNTWKPLVLMTRHFDYCLSASEGVRSSAPVVSRCFPGGYNVKLYISRGRLAWWLLAFLHSDTIMAAGWQYGTTNTNPNYVMIIMILFMVSVNKVARSLNLFILQLFTETLACEEKDNDIPMEHI